ncbi:hypothetical protein MFFC18_31810 [Mariniblastus fucicola]|uniref:Uncharacterized protein n=1 Tax=Mariniblastus fucicola TaxID=980251 RepID=A0A5B9PDL2_9BACT|nr:hypothetical protein MFFC18_31810 [Mariniblastus fucicola]
MIIRFPLKVCPSGKLQTFDGLLANRTPMFFESEFYAHVCAYFALWFLTGFPSRFFAKITNLVICSLT